MEEQRVPFIVSDTAREVFNTGDTCNISSTNSRCVSDRLPASNRQINYRSKISPDMLACVHRSDVAGKTQSKRPLTPQQAAAFPGLDDKTITRWARKRYLPAHPMGEGEKKYWRFFEHELLAWLLRQADVTAAA